MVVRQTPAGNQRGQCADHIGSRPGSGKATCISFQNLQYALMDKPAKRPTGDHREQRQYQLYQQVNKGNLGGGAPQVFKIATY